MRPFSSSFYGPALVLAALFVAPSAQAYEERLEISVGLGPSFALASDFAPGFATDLRLSWGLGDRWSIGVSGRYALNHRDSTFEHRAAATFDATWALDIVQWVPRLTLSLGPTLAANGSSAQAGILGALTLGADRITEFGLIGLDLRLDGYGFVADAVPGRLSVGIGFRMGWLLDRF